MNGPGDLVVEIVFPESGPRDRGEKFYEYEAGGVGEYWLIDPTRQQVELYRLGPEGCYRIVLPDAEGVYRSEVMPGFWLKLEWLWQDPLSKALEALQT